jgi:SAM-dependent methyltransferase
MEDVDGLLAEALRHPVQGWDFGWIREGDRFYEEPLPWDYSELVARRAARSPDLLDLGTGGGERLASLSSHPHLTVATESYPPNVRVAARRLAPLGIPVVRTSGAPDNVVNADPGSRGRLPFRDGSFHLVIDRNEAYVAREVARVLAPGGLFLTEQSGSAEIPELCRLLGLSAPPDLGRDWNLDFAKAQAVEAGLKPLEGGEARFSMSFRDVGALAWYLTAVPWAVPEFQIERHRKQLEELHERIVARGPIRVPRYGFWLEAQKP